MDSTPLELVGPLCHAAFTGELGQLDACMSKGADVNLGTPYDRRTALHFAAAGGQLEACKFLLGRGALILPDSNGVLPMHDAHARGFADVSGFLASQFQASASRLGGDARAASVFTCLTRKQTSYAFHTLIDEVQYFCGELGMHPRYFDSFTTEQIADHLHCIIAAKKVAQAAGDPMVQLAFPKRPEAVFVLTEGFSKSSVGDQAVRGIEGQINQYLAAFGNHGDVGFSLSYYCSEGTIVRHSARGGARLALVVVAESEYAATGSGSGVRSTGTRRFLERMQESELTLYDKIVQKAIVTRTATIEVLNGNAFPGPVPGGYVILYANLEKGQKAKFDRVRQCLRYSGLVPRRYYIDQFSNGVRVHSIHLPDASEAKALQLAEALQFITHFSPKPGKSELIWDAVLHSVIPPDHGIYLTAVVKYVFHFFPKEKYMPQYLELDRADRLKVDSAMSFAQLYQVFRRNLHLTHDMFDDFKAIATGKAKPAMNERLRDRIRREITSEQEQQFMEVGLQFNESLRLTNFFKTRIGRESSTNSSAAAIAFRFDPTKIFAHRSRALFPEMPHAIYLIQGQGFMGFHIRFRDIARGGIRAIRSLNQEAYNRNMSTLLEENYNLALTQQYKNKDIPEGGSKGTILMDVEESLEFDKHGSDCFFNYVDSLIDCMLVEENNLFSHLPGPELLFFGPDENTANFMDLGALRAKQRNYAFWKSLTTGKSNTLGGIPHDVYGMTTASVHENVLGLLRVLDIKEDTISKFQTGGPDGDLGSNEILVSKDRTIGIVDGSGTLYDPAGLDRTELVRLAKARCPVKFFDRSKLGKEGFLITVDEPNGVTLPNGDTYRSATELRDNFPLSPLSSADLFVPCGGRPASINRSNMGKMMVNGLPKWKYIVEGANLFFTEDAREFSERNGVHHIKDAAANKGGVTSSSLEVLAALAMPPDDHDALLCIAADGTVPQFYEQYAIAILEKVKQNARNEFGALWKENQTTGMLKKTATEVLSKKINAIADFCSASLDLDRDSTLVRVVLMRSVPQLLIDHCGLDGILRRVPPAYVKAMVACSLAAWYVYEHGAETNEFSFYQFMQRLRDEGSASSSKL